jgi:hypothetical protein
MCAESEQLRFWKYLVGSMIRVAGIIMALVGFGSSAFGIGLIIGILITISGVILYLLGRRLMISSR